MIIRKKFINIPLWVYILGALTPMIIVIVFFMAQSNYISPYLDFEESLGLDIDYATENDCLRAELDGVSTRITEKNAYNIYNAIINGDFSSYKEEEPVGDFLLLDFGNGDSIKIWEKDSTTFTVQYIPAEGKAVIYSTDEGEVSRFFDLVRLISVEWDNSVWE